jgi:hypothetical protein
VAPVIDVARALNFTFKVRISLSRHNNGSLLSNLKLDRVVRTEKSSPGRFLNLLSPSSLPLVPREALKNSIFTYPLPKTPYHFLTAASYCCYVGQARVKPFTQVSKRPDPICTSGFRNTLTYNSQATFRSQLNPLSSITPDTRNPSTRDPVSHLVSSNPRI